MIMLTLAFFRNNKGAAPTAPGAGPAPPSKRREQVRHAQRYVARDFLVIVHYPPAVTLLV